MRSRVAAALASIVFGIGLGCASSKGDVSPPTAAAALTLTPVAWNPANADVGSVVEVVEQDTTLAIFGSKGVLTFTSGAIASTNASITEWRSAAVIPSPDGVSTWLVGIDGTGRVRRVSDAAGLVDVSDRYGLDSDKVTSVASAAGIVAFVLESGFAVSDGTKITHYQVAQPRSIAMGQGIVALADGAGVRIFDHGKETDLALPDAQLVAYDDGGHLLGATSHALYDLSSGSAVRLYDVGARTIHQLGAAGSAVWLVVGTDLARFSAWQLAIGTGPTLAPDARLVPSPSGDVWVMSGGQLQRWSVAAPMVDGDEATWTATVEPVYAAVCSNCHSPAGSGKSSSNIDLSTYDAWKGRRPQVYARVVGQAGTPTAMPPPTSGLTLTDAQRAAIEAWSKP
jgi:mono/diheme cytochrome c family protein